MNSPLILFCLRCRDYAKIFLRLARLVAAAQDASLAVVRLAARTLDPVEKCRATRQASRDDVADKRFAFHDRDVRLTRNCNEIIGSIATQRTGRSEVKWNCN